MKIRVAPFVLEIHLRVVLRLTGTLGFGFLLVLCGTGLTQYVSANKSIDNRFYDNTNTLIGYHWTGTQEQIISIDTATGITSVIANLDLQWVTLGGFAVDSVNHKAYLNGRKDDETFSRLYETDLLTGNVISTTILADMMGLGFDTYVSPAPPLTPTPTSTIPAGTPTATPQPPTLTHLRPDRGRSDLPNEVYLYGSLFAAGATASLHSTGEYTLSTFFVDSTRLKAFIPAGLPASTYAARIVNPDGAAATLANAYTSFDAANDDLHAYSYELWSDPMAVRAGDTATTLGLVVHRQGGKNPTPVTVHFYNGNPNQGGTKIGEGTIALLPPRQSQSTSAVAWVPPAPGTYELFAVIDPNNQFAESLETNNLISRTLSVLPPAADRIAPRVASFTIGDGSGLVTSPQVILNVSAEDPTPGSGVASLFFQEFEYSQGAGQWVPTQDSGWLTYTTSPLNFPWTLSPNAGMKYIDAWAADAAGNVSVYPFHRLVTYNPPVDSVALNQTRIYRYDVPAQTRLNARIEPISGDPDLYIWPPDTSASPFVSNLPGTQVEQLSLQVDSPGTYQVEVYGYSAAEYRLSVTWTPAQTTHARLSTIQVDADKPLPTAPAVASIALPPTRFAIAAPAATDLTTPSEPTEPPTSTIYLPAVAR